jgi:hypothetical protein
MSRQPAGGVRHRPVAEKISRKAAKTPSEDMKRDWLCSGCERANFHMVGRKTRLRYRPAQIVLVLVVVLVLDWLVQRPGSPNSDSGRSGILSECLRSRTPRAEHHEYRGRGRFALGDSGVGFSPCHMEVGTLTSGATGSPPRRAARSIYYLPVRARYLLRRREGVRSLRETARTDRPHNQRVIIGAWD